MFGDIFAAFFDDVSGKWRWMLGSSFQPYFLECLSYLRVLMTMRQGRKPGSFLVWKYA